MPSTVEADEQVARWWRPGQLHPSDVAGVESRLNDRTIAAPGGGPSHATTTGECAR
ncbi:MAG: hypothetical protein IPL43_12700 [Micropruina sp.]|nr:hypothetical protein [Micropruina sp.]